MNLFRVGWWWWWWWWLVGGVVGLVWFGLVWFGLVWFGLYILPTPPHLLGGGLRFFYLYCAKV